jgi:hypothetical protein
MFAPVALPVVASRAEPLRDQMGAAYWSNAVGYNYIRSKIRKRTKHPDLQECSAHAAAEHYLVVLC